MWNEVSVENVDEAMKKIEKAGGRVSRATEGNIFGVMQLMPGSMM